MLKLDYTTYTNDIFNNIFKEKLDNLDIKSYQDYLENTNTECFNFSNLADPVLIQDIKETASYIRENSEALLVIGIGGSFLGARAIIDALTPYFYNHTDGLATYFVGYTLSHDYLARVFDIVKDKEIMVNVVSKSGSTFETDVTFDLVIEFMKTKYSDEELKRRIIVTTDPEHGSLRELANKQYYKTFSIPSEIGGRFSVFTPAGLLPVAAMGINIDEILDGVKAASQDIQTALKYAMIRNELERQGKETEAFVVYGPHLFHLTEWLKQLYAESLGKQNTGLLPIAVVNTRDLHSFGQYFQDGRKHIFETVIATKPNKESFFIEKHGKTLDELNYIAMQAASAAHAEGDVPNIIINMDKLDAYHIGRLMSFFMISCIISGYIENKNPFDQPGVENYKEKMRELLNK